MGVTLADVVEALEAFAPPGLAEPWDRPGLQVGDPVAPVEAVLVALDPSNSAVKRAAERGAQLLITHHPLLLDALPNLNYARPPCRLLVDCIQQGLAVYSSHTNLDRAEGGVNDALAAAIGLIDVEPLSEGEEQAKLVVTVPVGYEPQVMRALVQAGAGRVGNYEGCAFACRGSGTFRPAAGAAPFVGRVGADCEVQESRVETVVPLSRVPSVRKALLAAHPYEEPVVDVFELTGRSSLGSLGRVGNLPSSTNLGSWSAAVARVLGVPDVRLAGDPGAPVNRVAVCGGSGASLWRAARAAGAQVLLTGDVKYHVAKDALEGGVALLDAGHAATEAVAVQVLSDLLQCWAEQKGLSLRVETFLEGEPFVRVAV